MASRRRALDARVQRTVGHAAHDLLFKLLEPDPAARAAHFEGTMDGVPVHAFFMQGTDVGAAVVAELKVGPGGRCRLTPAFRS